MLYLCLNHHSFFVWSDITLVIQELECVLKMWLQLSTNDLFFFFLSFFFCWTRQESVERVGFPQAQVDTLRLPSLFNDTQLYSGSLATLIKFWSSINTDVYFICCTLLVIKVDLMLQVWSSIGQSVLEQDAKSLSASQIWSAANIRPFYKSNGDSRPRMINRVSEKHV